MTVRTNRYLVAASALLLAAGAFAQTSPEANPSSTPTAAPFQPIPPAAAEQYRFNFGQFFTSPAAYTKGIRQMDTLAAQVQKLKGKVIASPENLYRALKLSDDFTILFLKAYEYLNLQYSVNTKDTAARDRATALDTKYSPQFAFINVEIEKITPAQFQRYLKAEPRLKPYAYVIQEALRSKPHTLGVKEEELLSRTTPLMTRWQEDEYDILMDRAPWGKVRDPLTGQELDVRQDEAQIGNSPDRAVRKEGYDKTNAAYKDERDLFAFDFLNVARTQNELGKIRHFKNGQDASFFGLHLTYPQIDTAFNTILNHGDLRKRLQTMQRARVQEFTGYDTVHLYDMSMVPPGVQRPRFTIDQARKVILESTAYLGPEYNREMAALLNPKNGRLDIVSGENRVPNAFAIPSPGFNSVFYSYGYEGYLNDVSTLAHEGGHVVNSALQNNNHVPPATSDGPRYFTESYAILNELVLNDMLYRQEKDPGVKVYYLENLLNQLMGFYGTVRIADIEKVVYEQAAKGTVKNADDLDKITYDIGRKTSIWHDLDPTTNNLWEQIPHYYGSPTYYVNYVYADLLSQTYFAMYRKDPVAFAKRFVPLLRNGFNDTPQNLLKKFMGIDLNNPRTYDAVFAQQQKYLDELAALYQQVPVPKPK